MGGTVDVKTVEVNKSRSKGGARSLHLKSVVVKSS